LSSIISRHLRAAARRIAILACFGLFATAGVASASPSSEWAGYAAQSDGSNAYVAAPGGDSGSGQSLSLGDGTSAFTLSAGGWHPHPNLDPYRSG
jgi:hypothetical protein